MKPLVEIEGCDDPVVKQILEEEISAAMREDKELMAALDRVREQLLDEFRFGIPQT